MEEKRSLFTHLKSLFNRRKKDLSLEREPFLQEFLFLKKRKISEFLIPLNQVKGIDLNLSWEEIKEYVIKNPCFYYPLYQGTIENYKGYISLRDLVKGFSFSFYNWQDYIRTALTLPENLSVLDCLQRLNEEDLDLAFIIDEFSEFIGIVFLKDIIKELFFVPKRCFKSDPLGWIILPATTKLHLIEKCLKIKFPEGKFETLAGFIIEKIKSLPKPGERLIIPPLEIEVLKADEKQIKELKLRKLG